MSVQLTPSKRPSDRSHTEQNGKGKWQKSTKNLPGRVSQGSTVFRVLCPVSKAGGIIGKGGRSISQIRRQTSAKVRVDETVPGCDERVVVITSCEKDGEVAADQNGDHGSETNTDKEGEDTNEMGEDDDAKQSIPVKDIPSEKGMSSVQKALLLIFEKIVEGETEIDGGNEVSKQSPAFVLRLLVFSSQIGCLLGKAGSVIKQMASDSGAQIRILPKDKVPPCASPSDELVQISGEVDAVRKALEIVSLQLLENPPRDQEPLSGNTGGPSSIPSRIPPFRSEAYPPPNYRFPAQGGTGHMNPPDILTFRLLCPEDKVGGLIGKGGTVVKGIQNETLCEIKVLDGSSETEDRTIVISGPAHPDDRISAAQDCVLRVHSRIVRAAQESKENNVSAKIVVASNQIGCLLGKGGAIIAEMRKSTGAYIRIMSRDQLPTFIPGNEEVVQINGGLEAVQEALIQITSRLREHFFRDTFPSINQPSTGFPDRVPPFPSYFGRREISPPGMYSHRGPPFHKFDDGGLPPQGDEGFHPHDQAPFMHNIHRPGMPPHMSERMPSAPWSQGLTEGGGPPGLPNFVGGPQRRMGGFGGPQAIITNTTMEVVVPSSIVPVLYGEDGGCLKQLREITEAKITINDPKPGAKETMIIISGAPDQAHAAQSLIQAFVISENPAH